MRPRLSGLLLLAGTVVSVLVALAHPSGRALLEAAEPGPQVVRNLLVHSLALATLPAILLGLLGLHRLLAPSDLSLAALVVYGFAAVATLVAAVMSGFVATDQILELREAATATGRELLAFTLTVNHGFFAVAVVAVSLAVVLFSAAILRSGRLSRGAGATGLVLGGGVGLAVVSGRLALGLHGLVIVTLSHAVWLVWVGIALITHHDPAPARR